MNTWTTCCRGRRTLSAVYVTLMPGSGGSPVRVRGPKGWSVRWPMAGRVRDLVLAPRSKRLDAEALAREVGEAILSAQRDAERQAQAIMDEVDAKLAALPKALDAEFVQERIEQVSREIDAAIDVAM